MNASTDTYCLFCATGREGAVADKLFHMGYPALSPVVMKWRPVGGKLRRVPTRLLPSYVFFDAAQEQDIAWERITALPDVLRVLHYGDGARALRGGDLEFLSWIRRNEGTIDISRAVQVGSRIQFIDGPLKEFGGLVVKVNKNRKQVAINIGDESLAKLVWCAIEYVEANMEDGQLEKRA